MNTYLGLTLFALFLLVIIALIVAMLISLGKQGDERRKMIMEKASTSTFAITVLYILYCIAENILKYCTKGIPAEGMNPFITLTVIAIMYFVQLMYFKSKYGG